MIEESKYCSDVMKEHFNKKFLMPRKDDKDFDNFSRFWIYGNVYVVGQSKSRGRRYHITGINKCFVYRDCNVKV